MFNTVNHIEATRGPQRKHLKFPIATHPKGPYKHHLVVRVDTGADVSCMNEKTFKELFPEVELSVCPHKIQNFGNSIADISILQVQVHQKHIIKCLPNPARFTTETVPEPMPFEYNAQYIKNVSYNKYSTDDTDGTTGSFFQDHHTLHSYDWYNDNKIGQSSACTSRNFTRGTASTLCTCPQVDNSSLQTR